MTRERVVVVEMGADERDIPLREVAPSTELATWRGTGPERGAWEEAQVEVEYLAPRRAA